MVIDITQLIGSLGFPIAITVWLLYERSTTLKELTKVIEANTSVITKLCTRLNMDNELKS